MSFFRQAIRWTSKIVFILFFAKYFCKSDNTCGPKVKLGAKLLSITSICNKSAPAWITVVTSSPNLAKSADKIDGAIRHSLVVIFNHILLVNYFFQPFVLQISS